MEHYTKRTVALVLASVVTVVGAFGAENYKNSLMSLKFNSTQNGSVNMTLYTKTNYEENINLVKKDANTYVIMLPETDSGMPYSPEIQNNNIQSVNVVTMPYTTSGKGYTKVTVKTYNGVNIIPQKAIYIREQAKNPLLTDEKNQEENNVYNESKIIESNEKPNEDFNIPKTQPENKVLNPPPSQTREYAPQESRVSNQNTNNQVNKTPTKSNNLSKSEKEKQQGYSSSESSPTEKLAILAGFIISVILIVFIYIQSKEKMAAIVGEQGNFDLSDDETQEKKKTKKIRSTINKLDKKYKNKMVSRVNMITGNTITGHKQSINSEPKPQEIIDLDSLYEEKNKLKNAEQVDIIEEDDLAEFLTEFTFDEEEIAEENEFTFDEELYNKILNTKDIGFAPSDIEKINQLMQNEISDETISNLNKYIKPTPKPPISKQERLENFISTYSLDLNIQFSKDDVDALSRLMDVELDRDFVTNLHTNPIRTQQMLKELENKEIKPHHTSEIITLNVKDMLPDLSKELKKYGNKKIESNAQPQVVYYSEGYEVKKLNVGKELSELPTALKKENSYDYKPSYKEDIVASGYNVATLTIKEELPDLSDVQKHPEKYEEKEAEKPKIDENALLKNLEHVSFKPFYEEKIQPKEKIEIKEIVEPEKKNIPEETIKTEEKPQNKNENEQASKSYQTEVNKPEKQEQEEVIKKLNDKKASEKLPILKKPQKEHIVREDKTTEALINSIRQKQSLKSALKKEPEKNLKLSEKPEEKAVQKIQTDKNSEKITKFVPQTISHYGKEYSVIKNSAFNDTTGCYLCKNDTGYAIFGYIKENLFKLKEYGSLKTISIQTRLNEKNKDGTSSYLIKVGSNKFVISLSEEKMEFLLDLC